ncbi:BURP domain-containing protein 11 isoform X2 [Brachypodium distachyon]|uniref:BURP domain-containing protein 11 isoform X2 n=1 Tax=Brachypodium distachyon TaxID=15368 RepID=UPI00052FE5CF|nr:BURP domain-containing protein 11 isoform X2 [Brachypodium distachyon]|eukprot:XP_010227740.1 BURP domain-containing protein 11 isoform X2 [Brachypodium distachyon]
MKLLQMAVPVGTELRREALLLRLQLGRLLQMVACTITRTVVPSPSGCINRRFHMQMHNMDVLVPLISLLLVVGAGGSRAKKSENAVGYWQSVLPDTPIPQAILDQLIPLAVRGSRDSTAIGSGNLKFFNEVRKIGHDYEGVKSEAGHVHVASPVEEGLKEVSVSYGSQDEGKDEHLLKQDEEDPNKVTMSYGAEHDEDDPNKATMSYGAENDEDDPNKATMSYGAEQEEDPTMSYGAEQEEDPTMSYGAEQEEDPTMSYEAEHDEVDPNKATMSYGTEHKEDRKKVFMRYGTHIEGKNKRSIFGNLLHKLDGSTSSKVTGGESHHHHHQVDAHTHRNRRQQQADVFFFHNMLRPGSMITPTIPPTTSLPMFLPRHVASSIPFSTSRLADIIAMFAPASLAMRREIRWTLDTCEHPRTLPGQAARCATSLESLADVPASLLGTQDIRAFSAANLPVEAPGTSALRSRYNVTALRKVSGESEEIVTCHDLTYPYAVYYCHTANPTAAYMVTLQLEPSEEGGAASQPAEMEALAVCHLDTSQWSPKNPFFELHSVKPGDVAVCHFLTKLSIIWVRAADQGSGTRASM